MFGVDIVILNLIEFWIGINPLALEVGKIKQKELKIKNTLYELTATKNSMKIKALSDENMGKCIDLVLNTKSNT